MQTGTLHSAFRYFSAVHLLQQNFQTLPSLFIIVLLYGGEKRMLRLPACNAIISGHGTILRNPKSMLIHPFACSQRHNIIGTDHRLRNTSVFFVMPVQDSLCLRVSPVSREYIVISVMNPVFLTGVPGCFHPGNTIRMIHRSRHKQYIFHPMGTDHVFHQIIHTGIIVR